MISERKKRFLIFRGDLVCSLRLGASKESRVTLTSVYTPREQGIYLWRVSGDDFVQVGRGKKKWGFLAVVCIFAVFFPKRVRKATDAVLLGLLHTLNFKTEDYIG